MKTKDDIERPWQQDQENYFDSAVGYYELGTLGEAEIELNKITPCDATDSVLVLPYVLEFLTAAAIGAK